MKTFTSILEAQSRLYGGGNPFSNGHRSSLSGGFLRPNHALIDIDSFILDGDKIVAVVEKKWKADSRMGNILTEETFQKIVLKTIAQLLECQLFIEITSQNKIWKVADFSGPRAKYPMMELLSQEKFDSQFSGFKKYNSDDVIYIEVRGNSPVAIVKRNDGVQVNSLLEELSLKLGGLKIIKVDDTLGHIDFWKREGGGDIKIGRVNNVASRDVLNSEEIKQIEGQWEAIYRKLEIW